MARLVSNRRWLLIRRRVYTRAKRAVKAAYSLVIAGSTVKVTVTARPDGVKVWLRRNRWYLRTYGEKLVVGIEAVEAGGNHILSLCIGSRILVYSIPRRVSRFPAKLAKVLRQGRLVGMNGLEGFGSLLIRFALPRNENSLDLGKLTQYIRGPHLSRGEVAVIRRVARDRWSVWTGGNLTDRNIRNVASKAFFCFQFGFA